MKATTNDSLSSDRNLIVPVLASIFVTMFLFYIDEGNYNFKWMLDWGAWIVFTVYSGIILIAQLVVRLLFFRKLSFKWQTIWTCLAGIPLGVVATISIFSHSH